MVFYKIEGIAEENFLDGDRRGRRESTHQMEIKSEAFNQSLRNAYCFLADLDGTVVTGGMLAEEVGAASSTTADFFRSVGLSMKETTISEITLSGIQKLLCAACRSGYIDDDDEVLEHFHLDRVLGRHYRDLSFDDNLITECGKETIYQSANHYLLRNTFIQELDRIYVHPNESLIYGHPVHYIVQTDDNDTCQEVCKLLLQALWANKRLASRRYSFLSFKPGGAFSKTALNSLYQMSAGGTVLIHYLADDDSEEDEYARCSSEIIDGICETAKRYRNQVLTVLCLPRACNHTKQMLYENLGTLSMIEIQEDFATDEQAKDFLRTLAKEAGIRTDQKLFAKLESGKGYLSPELHELFDAWYHDRLRSTVFPQYQNIGVANRKAVKAAPIGSAYDELQEMVGLREAKQVIQKALDFYKIQKLYAEKGMAQDQPVMHMVFTGNPGTAKTTVARLFARIMKENGLLSKGQLIEVGRGDLVGKYVGWTAQLVKEKFKAALGGVLFIDEAYSLADGKDGSYGEEAINTIVQEMENYREDVVVIFAGYPNEMEYFLQQNPGLRSRIAFHIPFADYDAQELCQILCLMGKRKHLNFTEQALQKVKPLFEAARKQPDFGNGRYARNLLEQARMAQAGRLLKADFDAVTADDAATIQAEDIELPNIAVPSIRKIGFAV